MGEKCICKQSLWIVMTCSMNGLKKNQSFLITLQILPISQMLQSSPVRVQILQLQSASGRNRCRAVCCLCEWCEVHQYTLHQIHCMFATNVEEFANAYWNHHYAFISIAFQGTSIWFDFRIHWHLQSIEAEDIILISYLFQSTLFIWNRRNPI